MSPVLRRVDDPAMFPSSCASSSTAPSASALPTPNVVSSTIPSTNSSVTLSFASTIIVLLSFVVFTLWVVAIFLFAPSLRQQFEEYRAKKRQAKKLKKHIRGLGFGYDGLSQAEFAELRNREEQDGRRSFVRLSRYPPSLPPITISSSRPGGPDAPVLDAQVEITQAHNPSDSELPDYEQGDYPGDSHWQGSKFEEEVKLM